jgi:hypothetical protein
LAVALAMPTAAALALGGCAAPLESAGKTDRIQLVSSATINGWAFELYRNTRYPCSISGYQTFVIGTKLGSSATARRPLWVPHARWWRRLLRWRRAAAAHRGQQDRGGHHEPRQHGAAGRSQRPRPRRPGRLPPAVGVDVRPRHLLRRRPAGSQQPQPSARRLGTLGQRAVRHQGRDPVRHGEAAHEQDVPARHQRRVLRGVLRRVRPGAPGRPARGRGRRSPTGSCGAARSPCR